MLKIAILASGKGTILPTIFSANISDVEFSCLISNKSDSLALEKAISLGIEGILIPSKGKSREEFDNQLLQVLQNKKIDLIILVGFMRILSPIIVRNFKNAILNVHPSLLPAFAGGMDKDVHKAVLERGCKVSGATIHFVNEEIDEGPILMQECVSITDTETVDSLKNKVQNLEGKLFIKAIEKFRDQIKD